ncbi:MAG TPA: mannosyltransferase family protein [Thermoanaerobaculia bacterium]|nr:mannosyltransferase family protein [Thermoanaerobaculia bacterium]
MNPPRRLLLVTLAWVLWIWLVALLATQLTPWLTGPTKWGYDLVRRATPLARWDAGWYISIAEGGYGPPPRAFGEETNHAFFPLYPLLMRLLARTTGLETSAAGNLISAAALLGAVLLFAASVRTRWGEERVRPALLALLAFPTSFFFLAVYTESLFLFLALLAVVAVDRGRPAAAAAAGYLAGLTRITGVVLAPYLALSSLVRSRRAGRGWARALLAATLTGLPPLLGFLTFCAYFEVRFGDPLLFTKAQHNWGLEQKTALDGPRIIAKTVWGDVTTGRILHKSPARTLEGVFLLLFAVLALRLLREKRWIESLYVLMTIGLVPFTGTLESAGRYVLPAFPAIAALAGLSARPTLCRALLVLGLLTQAAYVWVFVNWLWAG